MLLCFKILCNMWYIGKYLSKVSKSWYILKHGTPWYKLKWTKTTQNESKQLETTHFYSKTTQDHPLCFKTQLKPAKKYCQKHYKSCATCEVELGLEISKCFNFNENIMNNKYVHFNGSIIILNFWLSATC